MTYTVLRRVGEKIDRSFPLLRYLVLQTETHAFCGSLAFFGLMAFYPFSSLLLYIARYLLNWNSAYEVIVFALKDYYPTSQEFLLRNLEISAAQYRGWVGLGSVFWIILGAAGFFLPLESAFNRLWKFKEDRPYWKNQAVGFIVTAAVCLIAFAFMLLTALSYSIIETYMWWGLGRDLVRYAVLKLLAVCASVAVILLFYKVLPNGRVRTADVFPAALLAGIAAEAVRWLYQMGLPSLQIQRSQGPYYVSISFALLAYFEAFVLLGGAFLATDSRRFPWLRSGKPKGAAEKKVTAEKAEAH